MPGAVLPLWQLKQLPVMPAWSKRAFANVTVVWHVSQAFELGRWFGGLPGAALPLWQLTQLPVMPAWSKRAFANVAVVWHVSQAFELAR